MSRLLRCLPALVATAALAGFGGAGTALAHDHGGKSHCRHGSQLSNGYHGHGHGRLKARAFALDRVWLKHIAQSDLAEIATGQMAVDKGTDQRVKDFGAMLVSDHTAHLQQVQAIAAKLGVTLPTAPNALQQLGADYLSGLSGTAFDQFFVSLQVAAHLVAIDETQDEIAYGNFPPARKLAKATLPVLQAHLQAGLDLAAALGVTIPESWTAGTTTPPTSGYHSYRRGWCKARAFGLDRVWLKHIAQSDLAEIATGQMAVDKGTDQRVKDFGAMLVSDHTAHLQQVQAIAARLGVAVPTAPNALQQLAGQVLSGLSGADFDQAFVAVQVAAHLVAIDETQDEIAYGNARPVVKLAIATLPVLQAHLQMAQELAAALGVTVPTTGPTGTDTSSTGDDDGGCGHHGSGGDDGSAAGSHRMHRLRT